MKIDVLKRSYQNKILIGLRTNKLEWDESIIGFIKDIDKKRIIINEIDENGFFIGNTEIAINDVISIEINDRYQKRLLFLHNNRNMLNANNRKTIWEKGESITQSFMNLIENKKIVTLFFDEDNYITGFIEKYDKSYVMIKAIGKKGDEDGISYYPLNKIIGLSYDGIEEQKIKLLHDNYEKFN